MSAREFAKDVLRDRLQIAELHEGENFRFGYGAEADMQTLTAAGSGVGVPGAGVCAGAADGRRGVVEPNSGAGGGG